MDYKLVVTEDAEGNLARFFACNDLIMLHRLPLPMHLGYRRGKELKKPCFLVRCGV